MNEILQQCRRLPPEIDRLSKIKKNSKIKMAAFLIAHICRKIGMCITLEVLHSHAKILNKNRWRPPPSWIFVQTAITQPQIDVNK